MIGTKNVTTAIANIVNQLSAYTRPFSNALFMAVNGDISGKLDFLTAFPGANAFIIEHKQKHNCHCQHRC